ncbi:MAG TPA: hypothetical protein VFV38_34235 [Ktedonobacteraceae bacterium]|nr:hypothetical protein [Ktedonobacteraceae bacterium]
MIEVLQFLANFVQIVSGLWVLLAGSKTIFDIIKVRHQPVSIKRHMPFLWWTQAISVIVIAFLLLLYVRPGAGFPTGIIPRFAVSAAQSTVPDGGTTFNKSVTCTNTSCSAHFNIMLNTGSIDTKLHRTSLTFTIVNASLFDHQQVSLSTTLQSEQDAFPVEGVGTSDSFDLASGSNQSVTFQFDLVPYREIDYTLRVELTFWGQNAPIEFDPCTFGFA